MVVVDNASMMLKLTWEPIPLQMKRKVVKGMKTVRALT